MIKITALLRNLLKIFKNKNKPAPDRYDPAIDTRFFIVDQMQCSKEEYLEFDYFKQKDNNE